jgi:hypothetical protein
MNSKSFVAKNIVEAYLEFKNWVSENNFDVSDFSEEIYGVPKECFDPIVKDLLEICEDNEEMKEAIKSYFSLDSNTLS